MTIRLPIRHLEFPYPFYFDINLQRRPLELFEEIAAAGDFVRFRTASMDLFMLNDPEYIKEVLVNQAKSVVKGPAVERSARFLGKGLITSEGDLHRRQRRLAQPAFHRQRIAAYAERMVTIAAEHRTRWHDGAVMDVLADIQHLTLRIVGHTLFGIDIETEGQAFATAVDCFVRGFSVFMLPYFEKISWLPIPALRRIISARKVVCDFLDEMIAARRRDTKTHQDLLAMLMATVDMEDDGASMTDEQIRDECVTLLMAGYETVANALTWALYEISNHPAVEARLLAEVDRHLCGRLPSFDDYKHLTYTEQVFAEAMRLHPPVWAFVRRAIETIQIDGHELEPGAVIIFSPWLVHRDGRHYARPLHFDPEHFTLEAKQQRHKFAYFPFGGGPRQCIGEGFAWTEGVLVLATLLQQWRLRQIPGQRVSSKATITLRPYPGIQMRMERRG